MQTQAIRLSAHSPTSNSLSCMLSRQARVLASNNISQVRTLNALNNNDPRSSLQTQARRGFHTTSAASDFHFDTHHFVQRLEREGLNRAQAEGIMTAMAEVIDESIRNITSNMVTKTDQEKVRPSYSLEVLLWGL